MNNFFINMKGHKNLFPYDNSFVQDQIVVINTVMCDKIIIKKSLLYKLFHERYTLGQIHL